MVENMLAARRESDISHPAQWSGIFPSTSRTESLVCVRPLFPHSLTTLPVLIQVDKHVG